MTSKKILDNKKIKKIKLIESMNGLVGSWIFLIIHVIWFIVWLLWERDINTLTMIVSLEAIILMILLLMSQNRQSIIDSLRDETDLQIDLEAVELNKKILKEIKDIKKEIESIKNKKPLS